MSPDKPTMIRLAKVVKLHSARSGQSESTRSPTEAGRHGSGRLNDPALGRFRRDLFLHGLQHRGNPLREYCNQRRRSTSLMVTGATRPSDGHARCPKVRRDITRARQVDDPTRRHQSEYPDGGQRHSCRIAGFAIVAIVCRAVQVLPCTRRSYSRSRRPSRACSTFILGPSPRSTHRCSTTGPS